MSKHYKKRKINPHTEVLIGKCVFSKSDIVHMYIDQRLSVEELAERLEVSTWKAYRILEKFKIPSSWKGELTPRRLSVIRYIIHHKKKKGKSPNLSEISRALDIPVSCVHFHIKNLQKLDYLEWDSKKREFKLKERCKECLLI